MYLTDSAFACVVYIVLAINLVVGTTAGTDSDDDFIPRKDAALHQRAVIRGLLGVNVVLQEVAVREIGRAAQVPLIFNGPIFISLNLMVMFIPFEVTGCCEQGYYCDVVQGIPGCCRNGRICTGIPPPPPPPPPPVIRTVTRTSTRPAPSQTPQSPPTSSSPPPPPPPPDDSTSAEDTPPTSTTVTVPLPNEDEELTSTPTSSRSSSTVFRPSANLATTPSPTRSIPAPGQSGGVLRNHAPPLIPVFYNGSILYFSFLLLIQALLEQF
ncbi:hypothetical protein ONZ45_g6294 [Pleurotus djamor]|nr:hypothetical protein ONZ45_g6294 [Pleurotus djamor]